MKRVVFILVLLSLFLGCHPLRDFPYYPTLLKQARIGINFCNPLTADESTKVLGVLKGTAPRRGWKIIVNRQLSGGTQEILFARHLRRFLWRKPKMCVVRALVKRDPFESVFYEVCYKNFYLSYPALHEGFPLPSTCRVNEDERSREGEIPVQLTPSCLRDIKDYQEIYLAMYSWESQPAEDLETTVFINMKDAKKAYVRPEPSGKTMYIKVVEGEFLD